jgi:phospholipid/cholesterol/gamma-HCH transport system substrate-binding protein
MNERRMQFAVGVVVLAGILLAAILMMVNSPIPGNLLPFGGGTYPLTITVPRAPGVAQDTPVRKNGVLIGRVDSVDDVNDQVAVNVNIDRGRELTTRHVPHVRTTVLGDATIDFETVATDDPVRPLLPGDSINGRVAENPFEAISDLANLQDDIESAMTELGRAGRAVNDLATRVDRAFGTDTDPGGLKRFMDTTETAMTEFAQTMRAINEILGEDAPAGAQPARQQPIQPQPAPRQFPGAAQPLPQDTADGRQMRLRLREGLNELPEAIRQTRESMERFQQVLNSAERNFKNLEGFTEPLGRRGEQVANSIVEAVDGLDRLVEEFTLLAEALNRREGTVGRLIHDPELYRNLNQAAVGANQTLEQIYRVARLLEPVARDARIFMDKVGQEPGRIISGAISPSQAK